MGSFCIKNNSVMYNQYKLPINRISIFNILNILSLIKKNTYNMNVLYFIRVDSTIY